jgi:glycosyltransferase involved in cell wall biosynthesis
MNSTLPTVSVVITHFRRPEELKRALRSVMEQKDVILEVIVVDDCSGDNFLPALNQIKLSYQSLTLIMNEVNLGSQRSRNIGIDSGRGDYIAFLDCDDEWLPSKLNKQIKFLQKESADICSCGMIFKPLGLSAKTDKSYLRFDVDPLQHILKNGGHLQTSTLLCKSYVAKQVRFSEQVKKYQDWDFVIRACSVGFKLVLAKEALAIYHFGAVGQMTTLPKPKLAQRYLFSVKNLLNGYNYAFGLTRVVARMYIEIGEYKKGFLLWWLVFRHYHIFDFFGLIKLLRKFAIHKASRE